MNPIGASIVAPRGQILYLGAPIRLESHKIFTGCNIHHQSTVIQQRVDFTTLANTRTVAAGAGFGPAIVDRFHGSRLSHCANEPSDDYVARLVSPEGASFPEVLLNAIVAVENALAEPPNGVATVTYSAVEGHSNYHDLIWECAVSRLSRRTAEIALLGVLDLLPGSLYPHPPNAGPSFEEAWQKLLGFARRRRAQPSSVPVPPEIPIVAVAGDKGTGSTARSLDSILRGAGNNVAVSLRTRAYVDGKPAQLSQAQQARAPLVLLRNPRVDILVTTVSNRQTASRGLLFNQCAVTVIGDKAREENTELFHVGIEVMDRATTDCFVVRAGNRVALDRLQALGARRLILVSERLKDPTLQAHLKANQAAVTTMWHDGEVRIALLSGSEVLGTFPVSTGLSRDGRTKKQRLRSGAIFAIAAAFALGLSGPTIEAALHNAPASVPEI